MRRIKVLEVLEATAGGTRKHLLSLLQSLDHDVFEVEVASPLVRDGHDKDTRFAEDVRAMGLRLHPVDLHRSVRPLADLRGVLQLVRIVRRGNYDVVHLHSSKAGFLGRVAAKLNGVKTVYTPNGFYFLNAKSAITRRFFLLAEQLAARLTDRMVAVSESEREASLAHKAMPDSKIAVIPNAIESKDLAPDPDVRQRIRAELGIAEAAPMVGTMSRFIAQKDPVTLVRAMRLVLDEVPEMRFVWCGEGGDLQDDTVRAARELGVQDAFHYTGFRHDAPDVMNSFDVFTLSSIFEGLPYALLEAMLMELPVVVTAVVGSRDVVEDGATGVLVEPRNPAALAAAIVALLRDSDRAVALGSAARSVVLEKYGIERMVAEIQKLYRSLAP